MVSSTKTRKRTKFERENDGPSELSRQPNVRAADRLKLVGRQRTLPPSLIHETTARWDFLNRTIYRLTEHTTHPPTQ